MSDAIKVSCSELKGTRARRPFFGGVGLYLRIASKSESNMDPDWQFSVSDACYCLDQIGQFQKDEIALSLNLFANPTGLQIAGGEPFHNQDDLDVLLDCALRNHMVPEVVTFARWADSLRSTNDILARFKGKLNPLTIYAHSSQIEKYGIEHIRFALEVADKLDTNVTVLCDVGSNRDLLVELFDLESINCRTSIIRVSHSQYKKTTPHDAVQFLLPEPPRHRRCAELMGFTIVPGCDIYPCSSSIGIRSFCAGNLKKQPVEDIMKSIYFNHTFNKLRNEGPHYIFRSITSAGKRDLLREGYMDTCDFHGHVLTDPVFLEFCN